MLYMLNIHFHLISHHHFSILTQDPFDLIWCQRERSPVVFHLNGAHHLFSFISVSDALGLHTQCSYTCSCFLFLMPWGFISSVLTHALSDALGLYTQ
jgi:hypothetical protein